MFDVADPRGSLTSLTVATPKGQAAAADYVEFFKFPPADTSAAARTWLARGQNFVLAYTEAEAGATLGRDAQVDEYMVLLPDRASRVEISTPAEKVVVNGQSVVFVPPGKSMIEVQQGGRFIRVFSHPATELAAQCSNAASYAQRHPNVAPLEPWPDPPGGFRVRPYSLDVPADPSRFGRIFRGTTMMVNWSPPRQGPRDTTKMSPHAHADFEQCSLVIAGEFVHHLRWPWTTTLAEWREDEHVHVGSPSIAIIPPPTIHTSQALGSGENLLIDIFCPPRVDFSEKPGWVLNAADYPLPKERT
ncbi:MAG TPA: hypothetical protein VGQ62_02975 [Chloroflexota bacterium]|jgi:mannose-6-phosphate isomerase-like protein (cupin superfamily)|nr:hypothetical protein [Chloroflexota bacterium]